MAEMRETASGGQALYIKDFPSSFRKLRTSEATEAITPRENILRLLRGETPPPLDTPGTTGRFLDGVL